MVSRGLNDRLIYCLFLQRPLMRHYYQNTQAVIFVVDSNDRERFSEAKDELHRMTAEDELRVRYHFVMCNICIYMQ